MDRAQEKQGLNWGEEYLRHLKEQQDTAASPAMAGFMESRDAYLPPVLGQFTEQDLDRLLPLLDRLDQAAAKVSYYALYRKVVEKLIVLLIDQFPEKFAQLSPALKDRLFGMKIDFPDEKSLYHQLYIYWVGREPLPTDMIASGVSMRELLNRFSAEEPELIDDKLIGLICALDSQYAVYFLDNMQG